MDIDTIATGETWRGREALSNKLIDRISTIDEILVEFAETGHSVLQVQARLSRKKSLFDMFGDAEGPLTAQAQKLTSNLIRTLVSPHTTGTSMQIGHSSSSLGSGQVCSVADSTEMALNTSLTGAHEPSHGQFAPGPESREHD